MSRRSPRRQPGKRRSGPAGGPRGLIPLAGVLFPYFPGGSGASGEIKSRDSVPPKSLPFIPLSSFLRLYSPRGVRSPGRRLSRSRRGPPQPGDPARGALRAAAALPPPGRAPRPLGAGAEGREAARPPWGTPAQPSLQLPPLSGHQRGARRVPGCRENFQLGPAGDFSRFPPAAALPGGELSARGAGPPPRPAAAGAPLRGRLWGGLQDLICKVFLSCLKVGGTWLMRRAAGSVGAAKGLIR